MSLSLSCRLLGISRQAIYQQEKRKKVRAFELSSVKDIVIELRRFMPRIGTRKLYWLIKPKLKAASIKLGRDAFFSYLKAHNLLVKPKRSYTKTTNSKHWMKKHPNLLKEFKPQQAEQVFASDITYIESDEGVHYLSLVTDTSSRKIMGHEFSHDMKAESVVKALRKSERHRLSAGSVIHHSDRGLQYCSSVYQDELRRQGMMASMTDGYDCYQNALAERINGILKQEFLLYKCSSFNELKALVEESIEIYNTMRPHLSLGMKTPNEAHKKAS